RGAFPMSTVAFSPDGKFMLAADVSFAARVLVLDATTGKDLRELSGHGRYVNQIAFSPDSKLVYTGGHPHGPGFASPDTTVVVWDLNSGKRLKEFQSEIWALSSDGKVLLLAENHRPVLDFNRFGGDEQPPRKPIPARFTLRFVDTS